MANGNVKFIFLILHYKNFSITDRCIESILKIEGGSNVTIVVADNGSQNNSTELLKEKYKDNHKIDILILNSGNGFSRGNNLAYQYIKQNYRFDYLVATNNDVIFTQYKFISKVCEEYDRFGYHVLGMDMIDVNSLAHLNPKYVPLSKSEIDRKILIDEKRIGRFELRPVIMLFFQQSALYDCYVRKIRKKRKKVMKQERLASKYTRDRVLQGGCLVFSSKFINSENKLFWPETTFYYEEDILYHRCKKNGWIMLYSPRVKVLHEQGSSFREQTNSILKRIERGKRYNLESLKIFQGYLES